MRITKLLALAAATVVVAACNGTAPTSPNAIVASDDATALVESQALKPVDTSPCRDITEVRLERLRQPANASPWTIMIEAVYLVHGQPSRCQAGPDWSSRPLVRLIRTKNPFIVGVVLTRPPGTVQVTGQAPNGVLGRILVP